MVRPMASFQGTLQCRVCEARITVAADRQEGEAGESADAKASISCPICESTVSFDAPGDIDVPSVHVKGFEYQAEPFRQRTGPRPGPETEGE